MLQNKQNEQRGNAQGVTYTEMKVFQSPQKHRVAQTRPSPVTARQESVSYAQLEFNSAPRPPRRKCFIREKRKARGSTAWQVMTGMLGVLCMVLMTTVGVLLPNLFLIRKEENGKISPLPTVSSKNKECPCDLGSHSWIGFRNNYYRFSNENKTWPESRAACSELNAHLLKIDTKEELDFFSLFGMEGWIGIKRNETNGSWLWEDGTHVKPSLFEFQEKKSHSCAYMKGMYIYPNDCISRNTYICEYSVS